jgi:hypothetical protein
VITCVGWWNGSKQHWYFGLPSLYVFGCLHDCLLWNKSISKLCLLQTIFDELLLLRIITYPRTYRWNFSKEESMAEETGAGEEGPMIFGVTKDSFFQFIWYWVWRIQPTYANMFPKPSRTRILSTTSSTWETPSPNSS